MPYYLRTQNDQPRFKKFDYPLDADHLLVGDRDFYTPCPACQQPFKAGELVALVILGPGSNPEAQMRCRSNRPYSAVCVAVHTQCVTGELP